LCGFDNDYVMTRVLRKQACFSNDIEKIATLIPRLPRCYTKFYEIIDVVKGVFRGFLDHGLNLMHQFRQAGYG